MKNQGITESQLISGVGMVPDGIYELISKQREGWGYIKVTTK
jgi:intracellular sulfur oxidation DsrE/DsrF family protein